MYYKKALLKSYVEKWFFLFFTREYLDRHPLIEQYPYHIDRVFSQHFIEDDYKYLVGRLSLKLDKNLPQNPNFDSIDAILDFVSPKAVIMLFYAFLYWTATLKDPKSRPRINESLEEHNLFVHMFLNLFS